MKIEWLSNNKATRFVYKFFALKLKRLTMNMKWKPDTVLIENLGLELCAKHVFGWKSGCLLKNSLWKKWLWYILSIIVCKQFDAIKREGEMNRFLIYLAGDIRFAPLFINVKKRSNCHFNALQFLKLIISQIHFSLCN